MIARGPIAGGRGLVVDASVSAAWFFPDEATEETRSVLHATTAQDIWVPASWLLETANLLLAAYRRKRISAVDRQRVAEAAGALRLKIDREAVSIATLEQLGARYALTAYDAAYLELAMRRRLPLATRDKALALAMATAGVRAVLTGGATKS